MEIYNKKNVGGTQILPILRGGRPRFGQFLEGTPAFWWSKISNHLLPVVISEYMYIYILVSDWLHLNGSVPQGSRLGPFLYVLMINDLVANSLLLHKFMDDSIVTETIDNPAESKMRDASDNVVKWTEENNTRINGTKTKEMIITFQNNYLHNLQVIPLQKASRSHL